VLIKGIDFPEALLRSQEEGDLVVFGGAGVSFPPPSSLPLFNGLADQIGGQSGTPRGEAEPAERYLGRLKKQGVQVHEAASRILVNEQTQPHELHKLLVQLFPSAERLRIVTTNFDTHFSTAAHGVFASAFQTFYAPALPLGDDFSGLVYVHGCAGKEPLRCILTDEDFGRAYLTQAWASRFLLAMFSRYCVLFVGYSHDDTVMNYLARGLPPAAQERRFVFTQEDAEKLERWKFLGITPLTYTLSAEENRHEAIAVAVGEWVRDTSLGLLEKGQRIRWIAESKPPLEGEDSDYIELTLSKPATAALFFKYARFPEWITWLEKHQFIQPLFTPHARLAEFHHSLARWLTDHFFTRHAQELFAAIQSNGGKLHASLSWFVWQRLCTRDRDPGVGLVFSQWVGVLLAQPHDILPRELWGQLLAQCHFPEDKIVSVFLFELLTRPRVLSNGCWLPSENQTELPRVTFELNLWRDLDHSPSEAWKRLFQPNFAAYANQLEPIVLRHLAASHELQQMYGRAAGNHDPWSLHRQSIERRDENTFGKTADLLIDAARDILCHLLESVPPQAQALMNKFLESDIPVLRRLAIFGFGKRPDLSPDEKLRWLLRNDFVYRFKTDVFQFLQRCYAPASDEAKRELIGRCLRGPERKEFAGLDAPTRDYEIYNFCVWLKRIAPECLLTDAVLEVLRKRHPDFGERDHPELDYWSSSVHGIDPIGGLNLDELGARQPEAVLDELLACQPRSLLDRSRGSYCRAVSAIVTKNPEWGIPWLNTLLLRKLTATDLWYCVCPGWRNARLTPEQWRLVLGLAETIEAPSEFFPAFLEVLPQGTRGERSTLPDDQMEHAQRVAERIWRIALESTPTIQAASHGDWLATAINEPGGRLAEFWLQRISVARKLAGESWRGFPLPIGSSLARMLEGKSGSAASARIVFASRLHYFFSLDSAFTELRILPLFNWKADPLSAEQCWHGFLIWGRWMPGYSEQLLPHFDAAIDRLASFTEQIRNQLVAHIATVAVFLIENPLGNKWLPSVLQRLEENDQIGLARFLPRFLEDANPVLAEGVWERWFKGYWQMRLLGMPKPLLPKEAREMVSWPIVFGKYFPQAVELACSPQDLAALEDSRLFEQLQKKGLTKAFPQATAKLVLFFLRAKPPFFRLSDEVKEVWRALKSGGVSVSELRDIREAMLELGFNPEEG